MSVGPILESYDADKQFPVFGFGGRTHMLMGGVPGPVSHCFPINGNP